MCPCSGSVNGPILDPDWPVGPRERNVTTCGFDGRGIHGSTLEGVDHMPKAYGEGNRSSARRALAVGPAAALLTAALIVLAIQPSKATEPGPVKIAVFDFELDDRSAGRGIIDQDPTDTENLEEAAEEARRMLAASGRYSVVDAGDVAAEVISAGGIRYCNGCEAPLARKLGADQSMAGVVTRVTRTEYTLRILVRDARTGDVVSNLSTGLRMGANYSWPRGVKWLMNNGILSAQRAE